jgi:hypothetical protein
MYALIVASHATYIITTVNQHNHDQTPNLLYLRTLVIPASVRRLVQFLQLHYFGGRDL